MVEQVDINIIKKTQESLGQIIKKPPLTEKLLRKPPFRFLHDIVTSVISTTGFLKDVYTPDELNSENIKDKEAKIKFLQKAIDEVGVVVGDKLAVRPGKIVAGHEADKTNIFLQALAKAIKNGNENGVETEKAKETEKPKEKPVRKQSESSSQDKKKPESKRTTDKQDSKTKLRSRSHEKPPIKKEKSSKEVKKSVSSTKDPKAKSSTKEKAEKTRETHRSRNATRKEEEKVRKEDKTPSSNAIPTEVPQPSPRRKSVEIENGDQTAKDNKELETETKTVNGESGKTTLETGDGIVDGDDGGDGDKSNAPEPARPPTSRAVPLRPYSTRPSTSTIRKVPPSEEEKANEEDINKVAANHMITTPSPEINSVEPVVRPPTSMGRLRSARPASARPPPPVLKSKRPVAEEAPVAENVKPVTNLIVENDKSNDDEDNAFLIEEQPAVLETEVEIKNQINTSNVDMEGEHGSLVTQMLETKKDLETGSQDMSKVEVDKSMMADVSIRKDRDVVIREVDKMRASIQALTRSINPLGKMIDYLQEDVDSMHKELNIWHKENLQHTQALKREQSGIESGLDPLKAQLDEVDQAIQDQLEKIGNVKSNILRNEEKIQKLLISSSRS